MTDFLLPREHRKRKRAIFAKAHRAFGDLTEALRDMREFVGDIKPLYDHLGEQAWPDDRAIKNLQRDLARLRLEQGGVPIDDLLSAFNNMREEI